MRLLTGVLALVLLCAGCGEPSGGRQEAGKPPREVAPDSSEPARHEEPPAFPASSAPAEPGQEVAETSPGPAPTDAASEDRQKEAAPVAEGKTVDDWIGQLEGDIPPGGYLAIVSHGLAPAVKVAASPTAMATNELRVGELLSLGAVPGTVQKAQTQLVDGRSVHVDGTILGKVAGPFDPQTGTVPVFVTLQ